MSGNDHKKSGSERQLPCSAIQITLPPFIVRVLERRAKDRNLTVSAVVEESILDGIMLDEVQRMAEQSPDFARIAKAWIRSEVAKGQGANDVRVGHADGSYDRSLS